MDSLEHPVAALRVGAVCAVVRQRGHHLDPVLGQEAPAGPRSCGSRVIGEVAAVDHLAPERRASRTIRRNSRMQLRRAARDVERRDAARRQHAPGTRRSRRRGIISVRSGPASTWQWWQVWLHFLPDVDLQDVDAVGPQRIAARRPSSAASKLRGSGSCRQRAGAVPPALASGCALFLEGGQDRHYMPSRLEVVAHLHAVHQRGAAPDGGGHMHRFGHLLLVGALLQADVV